MKWIDTFRSNFEFLKIMFQFILCENLSFVANNHHQKINKYKRNIKRLYPSINTNINISSAYTDGITLEKEWVKTNQKVRWRVIYTNGITNGINQSIKYVCK